MSRYKYLGPYDVIQVQGQTVPRGGEFDATDDIFIEDQRRRGWHLFEPIESTSSTDDTAASAGTEDGSEGAPKA